MCEQIEVLDVIPVQMRQEHCVDILRRKASRMQRRDQRWTDTKGPGVEQDRPACDTKQQQRADAEQEMIGFRRQAGDKEIDFHAESLGSRRSALAAYCVSPLCALLRIPKSIMKNGEAP